MINTKIIATVDADGVILNFLHEWELAALKALKRVIKQVCGEYELHKRYGLTAKEAQKVWNVFHNENHWQKIPELPGAVEAIKLLQNHDYDVHIVTAIPQSLLYDRLVNFSRIGMPLVKVHCTQHHKANKLKELSPVVYFDDNPYHIKEAKEVGIQHRIIIPACPEDHFEPAATMSANSLLHGVKSYLQNHHPDLERRSNRLSM